MADRLGLIPPCVEQPEYNLFNRKKVKAALCIQHPELDLKEDCRKVALAVCIQHTELKSRRGKLYISELQKSPFSLIDS